MDVLEVIRKRRSIRAYTDDPVEPEALERILEAARLAPSAANRQEWRFVVVTDPHRRRALAQAAAGQDFVAQAPVVVVACVVTGRTPPSDPTSQAIDVTIALTHMALQAVAEGLGTCWLTGFYEDQVKAVLRIPSDVRVLQLLTVGKPAADPRPLSRLPLEQTVHQETW